MFCSYWRTRASVPAEHLSARLWGEKKKQQKHLLSSARGHAQQQRTRITVLQDRKDGRVLIRPAHLRPAGTGSHKQTNKVQVNSHTKTSSQLGSIKTPIDRSKSVNRAFPPNIFTTSTNKTETTGSFLSDGPDVVPRSWHGLGSGSYL